MGVQGVAGRCIGHQGGARRFREEEGGALRKVIFNLIVLENSIRRRCVNDTAKLQIPHYYSHDNAESAFGSNTTMIFFYGSMK